MTLRTDARLAESFVAQRGSTLSYAVHAVDACTRGNQSATAFNVLLFDRDNYMRYMALPSSATPLAAGSARDVCDGVFGVALISTGGFFVVAELSAAAAAAAASVPIAYSIQYAPSTCTRRRALVCSPAS